MGVTAEEAGIIVAIAFGLALVLYVVHHVLSKLVAPQEGRPLPPAVSNVLVTEYPQHQSFFLAPASTRSNHTPVPTTVNSGLPSYLHVDTARGTSSNLKNSTAAFDPMRINLNVNETYQPGAGSQSGVDYRGFQNDTLDQVPSSTFETGSNSPVFASPVPVASTVPVFQAEQQPTWQQTRSSAGATGADSADDVYDNMDQSGNAQENAELQDINNSIISMLSQNSENDAKDADAVNNIAVDVDTAPNSAQQSTSSLPSVQARSLSPVPEVNDHADQDGAGDGLGTDQTSPPGTSSSASGGGKKDGGDVLPPKDGVDVLPPTTTSFALKTVSPKMLATTPPPLKIDRFKNTRLQELQAQSEPATFQIVKFKRPKAAN